MVLHAGWELVATIQDDVLPTCRSPAYASNQRLWPMMVNFT